jgi:hypothetical protein
MVLLVGERLIGADTLPLVELGVSLLNLLPEYLLQLDLIEHSIQCEQV